MKVENIEINWSDVVTKLGIELQAAHRDAAMRYAMCESLKREIEKLKNDKKDSDPAGS